MLPFSTGDHTMTTPEQKRQIRNLMATLRRRATNPAQPRIFPGQAQGWISVGYETDARGCYAEPCATINGCIVPYEGSHYTADWAAHDLAHIAASPNPVQEYVRRYEIRNHLKRTTVTSAFRIYTENRDGTIGTDVVGHRFRVTVDGAQFWFGAHEAHDTIGLYRVTDLRSGRKVMDIAHSTLAAHRGNLPAAAKAAWKKFMTGRNEADVRRVIEAAPILEEATS